MATSAVGPATRDAEQRPRRRRTAPPADGLVAAKLEHGLSALRARGEVAGERSRKLSVRVDPGIMDAAARETGIANPSDLVNAALVLAAAAPSNFGVWLLTRAGRLPDDFELPIGRTPEDDDF